MSVATEVWGHINGTSVSLFTVSDGANTAKLCEYGATLVELFVPDKHGVAGNIVLSYDILRDYVEDRAYLGATIGRYANRIQGGFSLGGVHYPLTLNDGENNLHGHPAQETLSALYRRDVPVYRTDNEGNITLKVP